MVVKKATPNADVVVPSLEFYTRSYNDGTQFLYDGSLSFASKMFVMLWNKDGSKTWMRPVKIYPW